MDYTVALDKAETLLQLAHRIRSKEGGAEIVDEFAIVYGEIRQIVELLVPTATISVEGHWKTVSPFPNYIEAGFLSGSGKFELQGFMQLSALVGQLRTLATDPGVPHPEASISRVVESLHRFRECCQFLKDPPVSERDVQEILWIMLRAQFERVDREDVLPRFGAKSYRPDFGLPDLALLIEAKFVGTKTDVGSIQEELLADVPGYLPDSNRYNSMVAFVYDHAHKLRDSRKFVEDIRTVEGVVDVIVVPGIAVAP